MRHEECCKDVVVIHRKRRQIRLTVKDMQDMIDEASKFIAALDDSRATTAERCDQKAA